MQVKIAPSCIVVSVGVGSSRRPTSNSDKSHLYYTNHTLAQFLGWVTPNGSPQDRVTESIAALAFIEQEYLEQNDFRDLSPKETGALLKATTKTIKKHQREDKAKVKKIVRKVAIAVGKKMRGGDSFRTIPAFIKTIDPPEKVFEDINETAEKLTRKIWKIFESESKLVAEIDETIKFQKHLNDTNREELTAAFSTIAERANNYARKLNQHKGTSHVKIQSRIGHSGQNAVR